MSWWRRRDASLDVDASRLRRLNRGRDASTDEREFSISCPISGFGTVSIPWFGTDEVDARDSFNDYLYDDASYSDVNGRHPNIRSLYVRFNGQHQLLTFRTDWIAGFTVH